MCENTSTLNTEHTSNEWNPKKWSKETNAFKKGVFWLLSVVVEAFNNSFPPGAKVKFVWGYNKETGLKEIAIATHIVNDDVSYDRIESICSGFNTLYQKFSESGCEASFHFITDELGWFKEMKISVINFPIYSDLEVRDGHAKKIMEESKKEHTIQT